MLEAVKEYEFGFQLQRADQGSSSVRSLNDLSLELKYLYSCHLQ